MRKLVGVIVGLLGLALLGGGVAGAMMIGSDDVWGPSAARLEGDSNVMISGPSLLAFRSGTLRVTASNAAGNVFIGTAHPVDVAALTQGVTTLEVTEATRGGLRSRLTLADRPAPAVNPTTLPIWGTKVTGAGTQTMNVPLTGSVQQLYAGPVGKTGPLTVRVGYVLAGAHTKSLIASGVGMLVLLLGGFLFMRGRRDSTRPDTSAAPTHSPADGAASEDEHVTRPEALTRKVARRSRRLTLVLAGCGVVPLLSGCAVLLPQATTAWDPKTVSKPSLTTAQSVELWKAYDSANNAAIKKAATPTFDPSGWTAVDTDGVLMSDRYRTAYAKAKKVNTPGTPFTHKGTNVYAPAIQAYPAQAILASVSGDGKGDGKTSELSFHRKESLTAAWLMSANVGVPTKDLPKALAPGQDSTPSPAERKAAIAASQNVLTYLNTGAAKSLTVDAGLKKFRADFADTTVAKGKPSAAFFSTVTDQSAPAGSVHPVKTGSGTLVIAQFLNITSWQADSGSTISWNDTTHAQITGQAGNRSVILDRQVIDVALLVDAKGVARVLGSDIGRGI